MMMMVVDALNRWPIRVLLHVRSDNSCFALLRLALCLTLPYLALLYSLYTGRGNHKLGYWVICMRALTS
jgi:hypothetical protein